MICRSLIIALVFIFAMRDAAAEERWSTLGDVVFQHIASDDGIALNSVTAITEDRDHFLWFGTEAGLVRWDGYRFRRYVTDQHDAASLPNNSIWNLRTDRRGQLWIATIGGGVARYDRSNDKFVRLPIGSTGVSDGQVSAIVDDGADGVWIGTHRGLDHLRADGSVIGHFYRGDKTPASVGQDFINTLLRDRNGRLWVGTGAGLTVLNEKSNRFDVIPLPLQRGKNAVVLSLTQSKDGRIWIGVVGNGAFVIESAEGYAKPVINSGGGPRLSDESVPAICEARSGEMWFGTVGAGIFAVDAHSFHARQLKHEAALPYSLADDTVMRLFHDSAGMVWVGTEGGVARTFVDQDAFTTLSGGVKGANRIADASVTAVASTDDGNILLGLNRLGVNFIDKEAMQVTWLSSRAGQTETALPQATVYSISGAPKGIVFIGTQGGLYRSDLLGKRVDLLKLPERDARAPIYSLLQDGGKIWIGATGGLWQIDASDSLHLQTMRAPGTEQLGQVIVTAIARGADGMLWLGTQGRGLFSYNPATHQLQKLETNTANNTEQFAHNYISTVLIDSAGRLWVGAVGAGIALFSDPGKSGTTSVTRIGVEKGLPNDNVNKFLDDGAGQIWVSTDGGLASIDEKSFAVRSYQKAEGVAFTAYYTNGGAITSHGELIFGGVGGVTVVRPERYREWNYRPPVVVTNVKLGGKTVPSSRFNGGGELESEPLIISPDANSIAVEFSALDYTSPEKNRYAYRLDGFDKDWVDVASNLRLASYTNLPPGDYHLHLRGSNRNGAWTEKDLALPIHVLSAWHQTWWAHLIEAIAAAAIFFATIQARTHYLRKRQHELEIQVDRRTQELKENQGELLDKNEELARLNAQQEEQQSELTRFLAVASHDLRQPMHALNLYLGALHNYQLPDAAQSVLDNVRQCARIMDSMFLSLLDLSRLDSNIVEPKIDRFPMATLLSAVAVEFTPHANAKNLTLRIARCSAWVESDVVLVGQILSNLVANAVRYTESGTILIGCRRKGKSLRLAVFDTGIGISPDQQKTVFEEFCQIGNVGRDRSQGLGLGLAIVRRLARLLSTPITLISALGQGSMFAIDLPMAAAPTVAMQDPGWSEPSFMSSVSTSNFLEGRLIVVIDDEESILDAMRILLQQWGSRVVTAVSGAAAIEELKDTERVPDLIICDYRLRLHETGLATIQALRAEFNQDITALIITGTVTPERIREMSGAGMPVLHKPINAPTLHNMLVRLIGNNVADGQ